MVPIKLSSTSSFQGLELSNWKFPTPVHFSSVMLNIILFECSIFRFWVHLDSYSSYSMFQFFVEQFGIFLRLLCTSASRHPFGFNPASFVLIAPFVLIRCSSLVDGYMSSNLGVSSTITISCFILDWLWCKWRFLMPETEVGFYWS